MYIKDASGKTYKHFGGSRDPVATDPHESSQFFDDTSAVWRDDATGKRGVLFDPITKEIIKLSTPSADEIKVYLKELERALRLVNYETIPLPPFVSYGLKNVIQTFEQHEIRWRTNYNASQSYRSARQIIAIMKPQLVTITGILQTACLAAGVDRPPNGLWDRYPPSPTLHTGDDLDSMCIAMSNNYDYWKPKLLSIHNTLITLVPIVRELSSKIIQCSSEMNGWGLAGRVGPMQDFANRARGMIDSIASLPPVPTGTMNATGSTQDPLDWDEDDDSMLEHRTFEFVPFSTGAADIPFLQGAPVSMITRVLEKAKQKLKASTVSAAVLEQNLQSLLDCTDPSTQHGFDPSPYPKTVVFEDLAQYLETMYSGTRNKRRFKASERLHVFNVDAGMNVLDYGNYENLWFKHVDPIGLRAAARRAMLSAATEDDLVAAIIQSTTASILCSLRMHLIHFSAALRPSEFAKITSMLQNKNSAAYKNFKSVLQETMGDIFEVKSHPLEHFEAKIMNFESSEAWFSSMLSLVYSACPLTVNNPRGLKRSSCSVKTLEDSYVYFHQEQPFLEAVTEHVAMQLKDEMGFSFGHHDDYIEAIRDEAWKAIVTKGFRYEEPPSDYRYGHPGASIVIEKGKIKSHSSAADWGFEFDWDIDGNTTLTYFDETIVGTHTTAIFDESGQISSGFLHGVMSVIPRSGGRVDEGYYVLEDVYYAKRDGTNEIGLDFYIDDDSKIQVLRHGTAKKVSTGTLANITTINFGNSAASGSPSQVYDDQIIGDAKPNDEHPVVDYAEQAGNLEQGEVN